MKKKLLMGAVLAVMLLLVTVSVTVGEKADPDVMKLTLEQAKELAMKNNHQVELAAFGVEKAKVAMEQAEFNAGKMKKNIDKGYVSRDQTAVMVIDVEPLVQQHNKIIAETKQEYTLNSIKYGVEAAYYGVLRAEKMLEVSRTSYKRAEEQYKQAEAKVKAGTAAKIDLISAESQLKSAEAGVNDAEATLKIAQMSLNKTLNLNLDTPLQLTDQFNFVSMGTVDVDEVIQEMKEKDLTFVGFQEALNISKAYFDYYSKYYTPNTFNYRNAEYGYKEAEVNLDQAASQLELNIKKAGLDLQTAEENYSVLTKSMEQAQEAYRLTKLRYDVGMATNYDVLAAEAALKQAELSLLNALYNYNLAKAQFTYGIFGGSSSGSGDMGM